MKRIILFVTCLVSIATANVSAQLLGIPAHASVYTGTVRGYWFVAPCAFTITGLRVSPEAGTAGQYIHVMKINDAAPVLYPTSSTNFTTLAYINNAPNNVIQTVSIPVNTGDIIGILGCVNTTTLNSYSPAVTPYATTLNSLPVTLGRLLYQGALTTAAPNYSTEATGAISRVEMYYSVGPAAPPLCLLSPIVPTNNSTTVCSGSTLLKWNKPTNATTYDVYLNAGTGAPTTIVSANQTDTFYTATTAVGPYTWKIVPKNTTGSPTGCPTWNFTTVSSITASASVSVSPNDTICQLATTTFTATPTNGGPGPSYQWKKNNVNVGSNASTYVDGSLVNGDNVKVVMTSNASGCLSSNTVTSNAITMTVLASPSASIAATGPLAFCNGGLVTLTTQSPGTTYQWLYNNSVIAGASGNNYNAMYSGYYKVRITGATNCPATSDSIRVTVYPTPFPLVNRIGLELSTSPFYATYQWYFNNQVIPGATTFNYTVTRDGRYVVKVTDTSGCNGSSIVTPVNSLAIPTVSSADISIYPNPANNVVNIKSPVKINIAVRTIDGKLIVEKESVKSFDIGKFADGLYILYISDERDNLIKVEKLVKKEN